jgi:hypothetical protein
MNDAQSRRIRFSFIHTGEQAEAELLLDAAPATCGAILASLPVAGVAHHAAYSGSEGVLVLPERLRAAPENSTHDVTTGDVGFTWFAPGSAHGVVEEFAEICWFYAPDARPSMHEGPVPVSIFARITGDAGAFYTRCRAMRRSGVTGLLVEAATASGGTTRVAYHDPRAEAPLRRAEARAAGRAVSLIPDPCFGGCRVMFRDDGEAWRLGAPVVPTGQAVTAASLLALSEVELLGLVAIGGASSLWSVRSRDGGATWSSPVPSGIEGSEPSLARLADGRVAVAYAHGGALGIAVSADEGATWRAASTGSAAGGAPVALPLADGRLACAVRRLGHAAHDQLVVIAP